jgi:hypothetical protein
MARETGEIFESAENVVDGTACSYEKSNGICIQVWAELLQFMSFLLTFHIHLMWFLIWRVNVKLWAAIEDLARQLWKTSAACVTVNKATALWPVDTTAELLVLVKDCKIVKDYKLEYIFDVTSFWNSSSSSSCDTARSKKHSRQRGAQ